MSFSIKKAISCKTNLRLSKIPLIGLLVYFLMSCSTQGVQKGKIGTSDVEDLAKEEAVNLELERLRDIEEQRAQDEDQERERKALAQQREAAERERIAAEERRQEAKNAERSRVESEREQQREEEREKMYSLAVLEQKQKKELISQMEAQLTFVQSALAQDEASIDSLRQAILVGEELLAALVADQAKYESTDVVGETLEPLAKTLISELEARLENLTQQAVAP